MFESDSALYWRRRGVAIASVVAVVLIMVWAMSAPGDPASDDGAAEALSTAGVSLQAPAESSPVPPAGEPVAGSAQPVGANGQPAAAPAPGQPALPAAGLPAAGLPAAGLPAAGLPAAGLPAAGLPAAGLPAAGLPAAGLPAAGLPAAGLPAAGLPAAGLPAAGSPTAGTGTSRTEALPAGRTPASGLPANAARGPIPHGLSPNGTTAPSPAASGPTAPSPKSTAVPGANGARTPQGTAAQVPPGQVGARPPQSTTAAGRPGTTPTEGDRARPTAVGACTDKAISVQAQTGAESYKLGQKPRFQLVVTNVGSTPCTRNLDPGLQEMVVTGPGKSRLWSSNDCFPAKRAEMRTLQPGKPQVFPVDWAGRTSSPGCAGERTSIGPGTYVLTAKLGSITSSPTRFTIVK